MSDPHSKHGWSLKVTKGEDIDSKTQESDADRASRSAVIESHDSIVPAYDVRDCHAACWLPHCRLGSCCRPGWKNALEEPLCYSRSMATPLKRHESLALLPSLLSNLAVSRTRSDPCIFGKDFLRITLPLPGEPKDCEVDFVEESELSASGTWEAMSLVGFGTQEASSVAVLKDEHKAIHGIAGPGIDDTKLSIVRNFGRSLSNGMEDSQDFDVDLSERALQEANVGFGGVKEPSVGYQREPDLGLQSAWASSNKFIEFDVKRPSLKEGSCEENFGDSSPHESAASDSLMEGVTNSLRLPALRTPQWDDWWTCQPNACNVKDRPPGERRVKCRDKSKDQSLTPAMVTEMDQAEEEGSDEGYMVLDEHQDQQLGSIEDDGGNVEFYDNDDEGNIQEIYAKEYTAGDYAEEELAKDGERGVDNSTKAYKEDDIWSDEHFVSSQVKGFPPPISILANETHPGLPGHMPRTLWRSVKRDGRFVLQEVQARPREFFRATREYGRLRLQLVRPDSDPVGGYSETADMSVPEGACAPSENKEDSSGSVSSVFSESTGDVARNPGTYQREDCGIVVERGISGSSFSSVCGGGCSDQGLQTFQPEDCWTTQNDENSVAGPEDNGAKTVGALVPATLLPKECGSVLDGGTSGNDLGQNGREMCGLRTSADAGVQQVPEQIDTNVTSGVSCATKHSNTSYILEEMLREKMLVDESDQSKIINEILLHESAESKKESLNESGAYKTDEREKFPSSGLKSEHQVLGVGIMLNTGQKLDMGQTGKDQIVERMGNVKLCTKLDAGQVQEMKDLDICNHRNVVPPTVQGNEEQYRQDYQLPCFNTAYGFDNNLNVLSSSQAFMQFPIQPAVR